MADRKSANVNKGTRGHELGLGQFSQIDGNNVESVRPKEIQEKDLPVCGHCYKHVTDKGNDSHGLCCDCCGYWVHIECEGMNLEQYGMWKKIGSRAKFYCNVRKCSDMAEKFFAFLGPLQEKVDENSKRIDELETRFDNVKQDCDNVIDQKVATLVDESFKDIITDEVKEVVNHSIEREKDRVYRSRNVIVAGFPESNEMAMDDQRQCDLNRLKNLLSDELLLDLSILGIVECNRLGNKSPNRPNTPSSPIKPRLLKVRFTVEDTVMKVVKSAWRLGQSGDDVINNIKIFRDKNKDDRTLEKELIKEAQQRNHSEADDTVIWKVDYRKKGVIRVKKDAQNWHSFRI